MLQSLWCHLTPLPSDRKAEILPTTIRTNSGVSLHTIGGTPRSALTKVEAWRISLAHTYKPAPFNKNAPPKSANEFEEYLANDYDHDRRQTTRLFRVEQQHSRHHIDTESGDLKTLLGQLDAFPALNKVLKAFHREFTDCYSGKAAVHFSPVIKGDVLLEVCCLLKYVELHDRPLPPLERGREGYYEVQRWSVRQMAFYQSLDSSRDFESVLLINPSIQLVCDLPLRYKKKPDAKPYENWMRLPLVVFRSLAANWPEYVSSLHQAVGEVHNDADFTDPKKRRSDEADTNSLKTCAELMDSLQEADHVLGNNIIILETALRFARKREVVASQPSERDLALFEANIEDIVTELQFHRNHISLIMSRLDKTSTTISNLIQLRGSHNMEQMTKRSILEARAVRIIALVTLFFIPPTFTAGFLQMDGLDFKGSRSGHLIVHAKPEFLFFLAITIPLMAIVIGAWLVYDWHSTRKSGKGGDIELL